MDLALGGHGHHPTFGLADGLCTKIDLARRLMHRFRCSLVQIPTGPIPCNGIFFTWRGLLTPFRKPWYRTKKVVKFRNFFSLAQGFREASSEGSPHSRIILRQNQRPINNVRMSSNPSNIGCTPINIAVVEIEYQAMSYRRI